MTFSAILIAAEGALTLVGSVQSEVGWMVFDAGYSFAVAGWIAATLNALLTLLALVMLFASASRLARAKEISMLLGTPQIWRFA